MLDPGAEEESRQPRCLLSPSGRPSSARAAAHELYTAPPPPTPSDRIRIESNGGTSDCFFRRDDRRATLQPQRSSRNPLLYSRAARPQGDGALSRLRSARLGRGLCACELLCRSRDQPHLRAPPQGATGRRGGAGVGGGDERERVEVEGAPMG
jgi:hypothetical protein